MKIIIAGVAVIVIAGGIILFRQGSNDKNVTGTSISGGLAKQTSLAGTGNVSVVDGKQIIDIQVKGGYRPKKSTAKAGIPTVLRFTTNGTFDCSSAVTVPSMKINKSLPSTGSVDIEIEAQQISTLQGTCSMGMYNFEVKFE